MVNKLVVMYMVNREKPENTWSGTSYSLLTALKKYVDVELVDLHEGVILNNLRKLMDIFGNRHKSVFFGPLHNILLKMKAAWLLKKYKNIPVLEIANEVKIRSPYYLYQDMALAQLPEIYQNLKTDDSSGGLRLNLSKGELKRRIELQRKIYSTVEKSFFMGKWVVDDMKRLYPDMAGKFLHAGGGLNREFVIPDIIDLSAKEKLIAFVGIDFKRKGGELVLEAFSQLREKYDSAVKLVIAGPDADSIAEADGVECIGRVPRKKISELLTRASLFVMPSDYEAYGLVFCEALIHGVPCIGNNAYSMKEFIKDGENGYLIDNDNVDELAEKMYKALNNTDMRKYVADNRQKYIEEYSWDSVAKKMIAVIKEDFNV